MFSLSLDPYHIYSLRYEDILSTYQIQYWDYKASSKRILVLNYELWSDINIIKKYKEFEIGEIRNTVRIMIDKTKIKGKFIIDASPTNIYNKFNRKFGNTISEFNFTPNNIIKASKLNAKANSRGFFNWTFVNNQTRIILSAD